MNVRFPSAFRVSRFPMSCIILTAEGRIRTTEKRKEIKYNIVMVSHECDNLWR